MPVFYLRHTSLLFSGSYQFSPSIYIERHPSEIGFALHGAGLPAHRVPYVFDNCCEPGPVGIFRAGGYLLFRLDAERMDY